LESEETPSYGDFSGISDQLAEQMAMANQFTGGPAQVFAYASGRPAGPPDYGPDLVRLIEETIDPDFWERNGGPGRIHYYNRCESLSSVERSKFKTTFKACSRRCVCWIGSQSKAKAGASLENGWRFSFLSFLFAKTMIESFQP